MNKRLTNQELIEQFRNLLSHGFYVQGEAGEIQTIGPQHEAGLAATKAWRSEVWKLSGEIRDRLDPLAELARMKRNENT